MLALRHLLFVFALITSSAMGAVYETADDFASLTADWERISRQAEQGLTTSFPQGDLNGTTRDLQKMADDAKTARTIAEKRISTLEARLESLGPSPAEGAAPEPPKVAELRTDWGTELREEEGRRVQAEFAHTRARELAKAIADREQQEFRDLLLTRFQPPIQPAVWAKALYDLNALAADVMRAPLAWWDNLRTEGHSGWTLLLLLAMPLSGLALGWPVRRWILYYAGRSAEGPEPTYARRVVAAVADGLANAVIPAAVIGLVIAAMFIEGLLSGLFAVVVYTTGLAVAGFWMVFGVTRAALSPHLVAWRILPVAPTRVWGLLRAIRAVAVVMSVSLGFLVVAMEAGRLSEELLSVSMLLQSIAVGLTTAWALSPRYWITSVEESRNAGPVNEIQETPAEPDQTEEDAKPPASATLVDVMRGVVRLVMVLIPFSALAGYSYLAFHLQSRILATMLLIGFGILAHLALRELLEHFFTNGPRFLPRGTLRERSQESIRIVVFWASLVIDLMILLPISYGLMLLYGIPATTLLLWTREMVTGVQIGGMTISLFDVFTAIMVLMITVLITSVIRRWLSNQVLPNTGMDPGARNSVAAGTSYLGVGIGILLAISALGVDFTKFALVAGALSLGIGFGLRNVVENFAAGLLLLIERPIKSGDWIIVGGNEGTVRHISVRSTEIETFDRASVIIPNSELISSAVINWTHKNRMARECIKVGVAYGSDTQLVEQVLVRCARDHRDVAIIPPPAAYFLGFGDYALEFELRCFVRDTDNFLQVRSDLHFAIDAAFRENNITIPFPQQEMHMVAPAAANPERGITEEGLGRGAGN